MALCCLYSLWCVRGNVVRVSVVRVKVRGRNLEPGRDP